MGFMQSPLHLHVGIVVACTLNFASAQSVDWTDWTSVAGTNDAATGSLLIDGTVNATVSVSGCVAGTVINGTSTAFDDVTTFSPAIATGDALRTDHIGSTMGDFVITFSSAVTNPIFHMADRHHYSFTANNHLTSAPIEFSIVSGDLGYSNNGTNHFSLQRADWPFPFIQASDTNGAGTTANGTFYMLGTFTQIRLNLPQEDIVYFQIGDDDFVPVPEPSSAMLGSLGLLVLLRRKR